MKLNLTDALLLLGLVQGGVVIYATLRRQSTNVPAYRFFGFILLTLTLSTLGAFRTYLLNDYLHAIQSRLLFQFFPYFLFLLLGPALYFYHRSLLNPGFKLRNRDKLHFLPLLLELAPFLIAMLGALVYTLNWMSLDQALDLVNNLGALELYLLIPRIVSISIYVWLSWRLLQASRPKTPETIFRWLKMLLLIFTILNISYGLLTVGLMSPWIYVILEDFPYSLAYLVHLPIVCLIYFLTIKFMLNQIPWSNQGAAISDLARKAETLCQLMEEQKLYRDPKLKLKQLSVRADMSEKSISFILNQHFQKGFNDFVNEYRVGEAIEKIKDRKLRHLTLEGIAAEVGFSSRSTFYRAFKKVTQKLPTDFID
ncbi:MAG: helix-turn-helix domain-containing protein [Saprospiraceae bacterium]|nr:helix-turn-helix domain-containing protein [Saprospiraceae bacterium]